LTREEIINQLNHENDLCNMYLCDENIDDYKLNYVNIIYEIDMKKHKNTNNTNNYIINTNDNVIDDLYMKKIKNKPKRNYLDTITHIKKFKEKHNIK
jgi:hypothetical protein